jgi:uncharacterized protein YehS (DUF1456 family)
LRRLRYIFDLNDAAVMDIFAQAEMQVSREQVANWLKKDDDPEFAKLRSVELATFLNGFINARRGKKEGEQPRPESRLNNNIILRKLKIALNLQADDMLALLKDSSSQLSKHELSAFFRKEGHKHYRECQDQVLRNVLSSLQRKHRNEDAAGAPVQDP